MYLIHAALHASAPGAQLPAHAGELVRALADADPTGCGPVEHVSTHPGVRSGARPGALSGALSGALPGPTLGVYLIADSLAEAEGRTEVLCRRAVEEVPALRGWTVGRVGVPLVTPYYEHLLLAASGTRGQNGPGPVPST
ncbi:hypothetical protein [Streptomyces sp. NBC_01264]|uniref:hypothetical protein n=1 Tax=Streptomyces sp. NBC_01264 TaxID=2903804 RepID=UPI0022506224|nr:hypothetical protein [Streptomyces sp. NBC_01264]MCX4779164.1 hypothetical protein [Streptomyces sp. NBC_01264]